LIFFDVGFFAQCGRKLVEVKLPVIGYQKDPDMVPATVEWLNWYGRGDERQKARKAH
jgi:hypothetical protein